MKSDAKIPAIILGTWVFGNQVDEGMADRIVGMFLEKGYVKLDTAYIYGVAEEILGRILTQARREKIYLATKAHPESEAGLRPQRLAEQVETSLKRLKSEYVDLLYLHAPDPKTPIDITLEACHQLFRQGKFRELGLSNYAAWQVADIWHICKQNGWIAPTVYQGMYNAITRDVERELFPAIRAFGIRFYAYNPLAGGLLTGKYLSYKKRPTKNRFALQPIYFDRYWTESYFRAIEVIRSACESKGLAMADSSLRWMQHHSFLKGANSDGVITAASSIEQLEENLNSCEGGDLPEEIVNAFDRAWELARPDCPNYFRPLRV